MPKFNPFDPLGLFDRGKAPGVQPIDTAAKLALQEGLFPALPDELKAAAEYGRMADLARRIGRQDFATTLEKIKVQEIEHHALIVRILDELKRGT